MMAAASVLVSCEEKEENLGAPEITLDPATLEFGETGGADNAQTLTVTSGQDGNNQIHGYQRNGLQGSYRKADRSGSCCLYYSG